MSSKLSSDTTTDMRGKVDPETWLDEHGDCLYGFALLRVRKPDLAEDLVQETLLAAFRSKDRFRGKSSIRSWLVGILKFKIIDYYRKQSRETSFTDLNFLEDELSEKFRDNNWIHELGPKEWAADSQTTFDREEFWSTLQSCLSKLPPRVGDVFMLREIDDQSTGEICNSLSISQSNLWVMLHRARMGLRECLEMNWFETDSKEN
jgi:RNA polymerase sigma-70 factor (TIGR02943 family)